MPRKAVDATKVRAGEIGVRMYHVGFGDCFMIFVPTPDGLRKILVDCGSMAKAELSIQEIADQVIADATNADGAAEIDVVIATHRHRDHVSGFAHDAWKQVRVKEVWMPWTEHPSDKAAKKLRDGQTAFAANLEASIRRSAAPALSSAIQQALEKPDTDVGALLSLAKTSRTAGAIARRAFLALNALSNPRAMETLQTGFKGSPRRYYLPEHGDSKKRRSRTFTTPALPDVRISVLGPSHDPRVVRKLDPPKDERFLRLNGSGSNKAHTDNAPFSTDWEVRKTNPAIQHLLLTKAEAKRLKEVAEGDIDAVAAAVDSKINGTSLVLVIEVAGVHLLLAGDAQWGTWEAALEDQEWRELLLKTRFFKVGHHGSHNATPQTLVNDLLGKRGKVLAMVSTRKFGDWDVPRQPLLDALGKRSAIARSDMAAGRPFRQADNWTDIVIAT